MTRPLSVRALCLLAALVLAPAASVAQESNWDYWGVEFPTSGSTDAQEQFIRGVTALHLHMFEDAEQHFQHAQTADPDFAMAYWRTRHLEPPRPHADGARWR